MAWLDCRPRSWPERDAAKSFKGEIEGSVVRIRLQIARPMPRFWRRWLFIVLDVGKMGEWTYGAGDYDDFRCGHAE